MGPKSHDKCPYKIHCGGHVTTKTETAGTPGAPQTGGGRKEAPLGPVSDSGPSRRERHCWLKLPTCGAWSQCPQEAGTTPQPLCPVGSSHAGRPPPYHRNFLFLPRSLNWDVDGFCSEEKKRERNRFQNSSPRSTGPRAREGGPSGVHPAHSHHMRPSRQEEPSSVHCQFHSPNPCPPSVPRRPLPSCHPRDRPGQRSDLHTPEALRPRVMAS